MRSPALLPAQVRKHWSVHQDTVSSAIASSCFKRQNMLHQSATLLFAHTLSLHPLSGHLPDRARTSTTRADERAVSFQQRLFQSALCPVSAPAYCLQSVPPALHRYCLQRRSRQALPSRSVVTSNKDVIIKLFCVFISTPYRDAAGSFMRVFIITSYAEVP